MVIEHKPDMNFDPHKPFCIVVELYPAIGLLSRYMIMGLMFLMLVNVLG